MANQLNFPQKESGNHPDGNSSAARALGNKEDARELNYFLDALELQIFQAKRSLIEADREISAQAIKDILTGNTEERKKILEVFRMHNEQMKALQGVDFCAKYDAAL